MTLSPFVTSDFPPRWYCGPAWGAEPFWGWLHIITDVINAGVYFGVPLAVALFLRKRPDVENRHLYSLFSIVFAFCGLVHLTEAAIFYVPLYRLSGYFKLVLAIVSLCTLVTLVRRLPSMLSLRTPEQVARTVEEATEVSNQLAVSALAERQSLALALDAGEVATWYWDTETDKLECDDRLKGLLGLPSAHALPTGESFFAFVVEDDRPAIAAAVKRTLATGDDLNEEFRIRRPSGEMVWFASRAEMIAGSSTRLVGVNYDITSQKQIERALAEATTRAEDASRAKGEFLANMSHEIRTPLAAVLGCSDLLYPKLQDDEQRSMLQMVRKQGRLLLDLLNDILDLSKIEAGKLEIREEPTDVRALVSDIGSLMGAQAGTKGIALDLECADAVPKAVELDPLRLRQVLLNLVGNAIKFTESGGVAVQVRTVPADIGFTKRDKSSNTEASAAEAATELLISIDDTGEGIPRDRLDEIFRAFEQADGSITRRYGGTGLGLTICKRLVDKMGGELGVASEVGRGSTFTVSLPLRPVDLPEPEEESTVDLLPVAGGRGNRFPLRVLLAEDTKTLRFMIEQMLRPLVDEVVTVGDGQQALDAVAQAKQGEQPFDLILMDMQMPILDGFDAVGRLREGGYQGLIYAVSAGAGEDDHRRATQVGCDGQLDKPIELSRLRETLRRAAEEAEIRS